MCARTAEQIFIPVFRGRRIRSVDVLPRLCAGARIQRHSAAVRNPDIIRQGALLSEPMRGAGHGRAEGGTVGQDHHRAMKWSSTGGAPAWHRACGGRRKAKVWRWRTVHQLIDADGTRRVRMTLTPADFPLCGHTGQCFRRAGHPVICGRADRTMAMPPYRFDHPFR
jgi:hypothetical protein